MRFREFLRGCARRRAVGVATALFAASALTGAVVVAPAGADSFGQLSSWGTLPAAPIQEDRPADQFFQTSGFGVDPVDDSVYVLDFKNSTRTVYRLQKFSQDGTLLAATTIPRLNTSTNLYGIAVDHSLGRFYLLQATKGLDSSNANRYVATKLLVFSTEPDGAGKLVAPGDVPSGELPLPSTFPSELPLEQPDPPSVDPTTHDLILAGLSPASTGPPNNLPRTVVARISSTGAELDRFTDTAGVIATKSQSREVFGDGVSPDGQSVYLAAGSNNFRADVYRLPASLDSIAVLDGTDSNPKVTSTQPRTGSRILGGGFGPQLTIGPDGTLYLPEVLENNAGGREGNIWVRGVSPVDGSSRVLYGGGPSGGPCRITWSSPAFAADAAGAVFVFDYGANQGGSAVAAVGDRVLKFGGGGSGCANPLAVLKPNSLPNPTITVQKGEAVSLDASGSELGSRKLLESSWTWSGPEAGDEALTEAADVPPPLTFSRRFLEAGTYSLDFGMTVDEPAESGFPEEKAIWSAPARTLVVKGATPIAKFTPSTTTTPAGVPVTFDAAASEDPTGGACDQASGCASSHSLEAYRWEFDDGSGPADVVECDGSGDPANCKGDEIEETFANAGSSPKQVTVRLQVTSDDDEKSGPFGPESEKQITVNAPTPDPELTVGANPGDGQGKVTSQPAGIECPSDCQQTFPKDTAVTLTAEATAGTHSHFAGWSVSAGTCTGVTSPCQVTMDQSRSVTAKFDKTRFKLSVTKSGSGTVASGGGEISCGSDCEHEYEEGSSVTLTPTPAAGFVFKEWTGACTGSAGCTVTMSVARTVGATFAVASPSAANADVEGVSQTSAGLAGSVDNNGAPGGTQCSFQVTLATDSSFSSPVATVGCQPATISGDVSTPVFAQVDGLNPGTAYIYRVKAVNQGDTVFADPPEAFTTESSTEQPPPPPPNQGTDSGQAQQPSGGSGSGQGQDGSKAKTVAQRRKAAMARCRKLKGAAKAKCMRKASQIGRPKKKTGGSRKRGLMRISLPLRGW